MAFLRRDLRARGVRATAFVTLVLLGVAGWLGAVAFLCCLGRAAALEDAETLRLPDTPHEALRDRRTGRVERRAATRPWEGAWSDRRRDDVLRRELVEERERARREAEDSALLEALGY